MPDTVLKDVEMIVGSHSGYIRLMVHLLHMYPVTLPTSSVDVNFQEITLPPSLNADFLTKI